MLVLARKPNQSIMIGDDIEIRIVDVRGDQVKIGINAPKSVSVHRKEIFEEIKEANKEATKTSVLTETLSPFIEAMKKTDTNADKLGKIIVKKKKKNNSL